MTHVRSPAGYHGHDVAAKSYSSTGDVVCQQLPYLGKRMPCVSPTLTISNSRRFTWSLSRVTLADTEDKSDEATTSTCESSV